MNAACSARRRVWRYLTGPLLFLLIGWMTSETPAGPSVGGTHAKAIPSRHVNVDILPGESDNLIDTSLPGRVKVALLGALNFDVGSLDPESLRLGGVAASKRDDGSLVWFDDIDGDGRQDLLFQVWGPSLQLGTEPARLQLTGRTQDGTRIVGTDRVESLDSLRRRSLLAAHRDGSLEKLPPIRVRLQTVAAAPGERRESPGEEILRVAVLSDPGFDAGTVDPASVSLSGFPVTKGRKGGWSEFEDVDGDGRRDLLLAISRTLLSRGGEWPQAVLRGMTFNGRFIEGAVLLPNASTRTVTFHSPVRPSGSPTPEIFNHAGITINDSAPATPYPSVIDVGTGGLVAKVRVTLYGFTHTFPQDLDIVLVGPNNSSVVLMSDVGGGNPGVANVTLTFDDDASQFVPEASNPASGIYKPTNSGAGDSFPGPAPSTVTATGLSIFNTIFAVGYWQLFIVDDAGADVGSITGWSLEFELFDYQCAGSPAVTLSDNSTASPYPILISAGSGAPAGKVTVMLEGLTHPAPDDLDLLLVSPEGRKVVLMSDAGGAGAGPGPVTLTFDQDAPGVIPDSTLAEGVYRPFNYDDGIPDAFPAPAPPGPYDTSLSALVGDAINGSWQLYIVDDAAPGSGSIQDVCLGVTIVDPAADSNRAVMTIPQGAPGVTQGPAAPYPSSIPIYGVSGSVANVTVELYGFNHTYPDDLDLMLVGPQGQNVILMSDAGGSTPVPAPGLFLRFDNGSPLVIPDSAGLGSTTYQPANYAGGDGDLFPAPAPLPSGATALTTFNGTDPNGIWSLYVLDDEGGDVGSLLDGWALFLTTVLNPTTFCNDGAITIPAGAPVFTGGPAAPYPSTINVSGLSSPAGRVKVKLNSLHHTYPDDLDVLLVGPQGQNLILMSDAGGDLAASGVTLTLDDEALTPVPDGFPGFGTGTFHPINHGGGGSDPFPAPAPPASAATGLSVFAGTDPNGTWSLYVTDDNDVDVGGIDRGWCLEVSPLYPASGTTTIQWGTSDGTSLEWGDFGLNAIGFNLYRGNSSDLPKLQDASVDSCLRGSPSGFSFQGLSEVPPPGGLYWYLLRSFNSGGQESSPGLIRYNSSYVERVQNSSGACP